MFWQGTLAQNLRTAHVCMEWRPQTFFSQESLNDTKFQENFIPHRSTRGQTSSASCSVSSGYSRPKLATDGTTSNVPLMKGTKKVLIGTMNVQTLRRADKIPELIASSGRSHQDIVCIQEHRFIHEELPTKEHAFGIWKLITCSAWKNNANASVGGVGILLNPLAYKAAASVERITDRIMVATFHGNPQTALICCYSPTNVSDENEVDNFYEVLESVTRSVPKHNLLIIGGDFNAHLGQQNGFKFAYHHQSNRNGIKMKDYLHANNLVCLNTTFRKRPGQIWTHLAPNGNRAQLDYLIINNK